MVPIPLWTLITALIEVSSVILDLIGLNCSLITKFGISSPYRILGQVCTTLPTGFTMVRFLRESPHLKLLKLMNILMRKCLHQNLNLKHHLDTMSLYLKMNRFLTTNHYLKMNRFLNMNLYQKTNLYPSTSLRHLLKILLMNTLLT